MGPLQRRPRIAQRGGDPRHAFVYRALRGRRGVLGLQRFLLRPELVDPVLQGRQRLLHLLLFLGQLLVLRLHPVDLGLGGGLAGKRFPGQILPALGQCGLGLILEVINRMLELLLLELDPLARRGDRDQCLADLGDLVEHLLVGQIEHFIGLLGRVERLIGLGREYVVGPLEERHVDLAPCQR